MDGAILVGCNLSPNFVLEISKDSSRFVSTRFHRFSTTLIARSVFGLRCMAVHLLLWAAGTSMAAAQALPGAEFLCTQPDSTPPVIQCPPPQDLILGPSCQRLLPDYRNLANATDDCPVPPTISQSPSPGTLMSGPGTWTMSMTATDGSGNTSNCTFVLHRRDTTRPHLSCPPSTLAFTTWSQCRVPLSWPQPNVSDNCGGYFLTSNHVPGDTFDLGFHWIRYWIRDVAGNRDSCQFARILKAPELDSAISAQPTIACEGEPITLQALPWMTGYHWSSGEIDSTITVNQGGWYWVDITAPSNCMARDSFWLTTWPLPQPAISVANGLACTDSFSTYQWLLNGSPIPGATGPCTEILADGNYAVIVSDSQGCTDTSATELLLAREPDRVQRFSISPNPASDHIVLRMDAPAMDGVTAVLLDINGRTLRHWDIPSGESQASWKLEGLAAGAYWLWVDSNTEARAVKLILLRN